MSQSKKYECRRGETCGQFHSARNVCVYTLLARGAIALVEAPADKLGQCPTCGGGGQIRLVPRDYLLTWEELGKL